jgi:hypothetical protein
MTLKLKKITSPFNNKETFELFELKETTNNKNQVVVCQTCFRDVPISISYDNIQQNTLF